MDRIVLVMSGIPGSGKSTLVGNVKSMLHEANYSVVICSADDYHLDEAGQYSFKPENLAEAHRACLGYYLGALEQSVQPSTYRHCIIVDNTSLTNWERAPYMALADTYGFKALVMTLLTGAELAAPRNVHGVPYDKVKTMSERLEKPPPHWEELCLPGVLEPEQLAKLLFKAVVAD